MTPAFPPEPSWARAYRPLGKRTLATQLAVVVAAELALFWSYGRQDASFHWTTHLLVAVAAAALLGLTWLALNAAPMPGQLAVVLALHLVAAFPDALFRAGVAHDDWMDVFLGHVSAHDVPGGEGTWLAAALASSGLYAVVLAAWLRARRIEVRAGQAPGVGISA